MPHICVLICADSSITEMSAFIMSVLQLEERDNQSPRRL